MTSAPFPGRTLQPLVRVLPSRVRRNYRGGLLLDERESVRPPADSDRPESWIGSTTLARNPGLTSVRDEGLTRLQLRSGAEVTLPELIATGPEFYLGSAHTTRQGQQLGFLAKLLDSSMRLHIQAHPTAAFARQFLGSDFGKLEVYYVLAVRKNVPGTILLGFQNPPSREAWRRIVETQDVAAMEACFEPIPVQPGDMWIVPGGMPHAIGAGILMVEVMEPSDWVVRCEFEREGIVVPPEARFMNRGLDFCLDIFDYTPRSTAEIRALCQLTPQPLLRGDGWTLEQIVGPERTRCFEIQRFRASRSCSLPSDGRSKIVIQTQGSGSISSVGETIALTEGEAAFLAAQADGLAFSPAESEAEWLLCSPSNAEGLKH